MAEAARSEAAVIAVLEHTDEGESGSGGSVSELLGWVVSRSLSPVPPKRDGGEALEAQSSGVDGGDHDVILPAAEPEPEPEPQPQPERELERRKEPRYTPEPERRSDWVSGYDDIAKGAALAHTTMRSTTKVSQLHARHPEISADAIEAAIKDAHGDVDEASRGLGADRPGDSARRPEPKADPFARGLTTVGQDDFFGEQQYLRRASESSVLSGDSLLSNASSVPSSATTLLGELVVSELEAVVMDREEKAGLGSTLSRTVTSTATGEQRAPGDDTEWHECEHDCGFTRKGRKGYAEVEAHEADCNNRPRTPTSARSTRSGTLTLLPVHEDEELSPVPGPARNRQDRSQTDRSPSPTRYGRSLSAVERREWERTDNFRYTISAVIPEQQQPLALGLGFKEDNGKPVVTEIHHGAAKHLFRGLCVGAILDKITLPGGEEGPTGHGGLPYANAMQLLMDTVKEGTPIHLTFEHPWQRIKRNGLDIYINHETGVEQRSRPVELDAVVDRMHHDAKFPEAEFFPRKAPADQVALRLATAKGWADSWDAHRGHQQEDEHRMAEAEVEDSRQAQKKRDSGGRSRMVTGTAPGDPLEVIRKEKRAAAPAMRADFASRQAVDSSVEVLMDYLDSALHGSDEEQALALRPERPRMQVTVRVQEWDIVTIDGQDVAQWVLLVAPPVPAGSTKLVGCIRVRLSQSVRRVC